MKAKYKPKFIVLTHHSISIGEFKNKRDLNNFTRQYRDTSRPIIKVLSGPLKKEIYLPIF